MDHDDAVHRSSFPRAPGVPAVPDDVVYGSGRWTSRAGTGLRDGEVGASGGRMGPAGAVWDL